jgi:hypothetical protein
MKTAEINKFRKTYTPYSKPCVYDGLKLAVLFDEKDWAKDFGARWDANEKCWWLPYDMLVTHPSGDEDVVYGELNNRKMIMGTYGGVKESIAKEWIINSTLPGPTGVYRLLSEAYNKSMTFQHWSQIDVVRIEDHAPNGDDIKFYSPEKGRMVWDSLILLGYNRINMEQTA